MTFLSIDLDYFNYFENGLWILGRVLNAAYSNGVRVPCYMQHDEMLPLVNQENYGTLVNLDTHSDLVDTEFAQRDKPREASWISYVSWRKTGSYHWITAHNNPDRYDCNGWNPIFIGKKKLTDWKTVRHQRTTKIPTLRFDGCAVCVSLGYTSRSVLDKFYKEYWCMKTGKWR